MAQRPLLTIAETADRFNTSRSTLRRGLSTGRFPNAKKDSLGRWVIPVDDLFQAGIKARKTWFNEGAQSVDHAPGSSLAHEHAQVAHNGISSSNRGALTELAQLRSDLVHERAQVAKAQELLAAERDHVASLKMALRMIEKAPTPAPEATPTPGNPFETNDGTAAPRRNPLAQLFSKKLRQPKRKQL